MTNGVEFIPNQPISFEEPDRQCNDQFDEKYATMIALGDPFKFQFKRGSCNDTPVLKTPCGGAELADCCSTIVNTNSFDDSGPWAFVPPGGITSGLLSMGAGAEAFLANVYTFDPTKKYQLTLNFEVSVDTLLMSVMIAGNTYTFNATNNFGKRVIIFSPTGANNDLNFTADAGNTFNYYLDSFEIRVICDNVNPETGVDKWEILNGLIRKLTNGTTCTLTYSDVLVATAATYTYSIPSFNVGGNGFINIFGTYIPLTSGTIGNITSSYLPITQQVIIGGDFGTTLDLESFWLSIVPLTEDVTVSLVTLDGLTTIPLISFVSFLNQWVNVIGVFADLSIPYGCYRVKVVLCENTYLSAVISYKESFECTRLVEGIDVGASFGFMFDGGFSLIQRISVSRFNPAYPNRHTTRLRSTGKRYLGYAERDKKWVALFDYMNEENYDCLSTQLLCDQFLIDDVQYFFDDKNVEPKWDNTGRFNLAQLEVDLFKQETIFKGACSNSIALTPVFLCDGVVILAEEDVTTNSPLCEGNGTPLLLAAANSGTGTVTSWLWTGPDDYTSTDQNPSIPSPTRNLTGQFTVVAKTADGCQATATIDIVINIAPILQIDSQTPDSGGGDGTVTVSPTNPINGPYVYHIDGDPADNLFGSFTGLSAGVHNIIVIDNNGCEGSINVTIL